LTRTTNALARRWPRLLLLIPLLLVLWVPFYNRLEPSLAGIPFFYWYQLACILVGAVVVFAVFVLETRLAPGAGKTPIDLDSSGTTGDLL
jgi:hypothetical protein